jgi:hypothetical protein
MGFAVRPVFAGLVAAAALCCGTIPAQAGPGPETERLTYVLQFGGLTIADVMITLDSTPDRYRTSIKLRSRGIAAMFKTFTADMVSEGRLVAANGILQAEPASFRREWVAGDISSSLDIVYDPQTHLASGTERFVDRVTGEPKSRNDMPWNKRNETLKPVPEKLRTEVLDPMAAFIAARQMIRSNQGASSFNVPVFDGLRRYNVVGKTGAPKDVTINDETRQLISVTGKVEPVFGFDDKLQDRIHEGEGKIMFTADSRFLPVQIMVGNSLGVGVMNLATDCKVDPAPCDSFGQETAQAPAN